MEDNSVYYRLYKSMHSGRMVVVCMQWLDENSYRQENFVRNGEGVPYRFDNEEEAKRKLNAWFARWQVAPEFRQRVIQDDELVR